MILRIQKLYLTGLMLMLQVLAGCIQLDETIDRLALPNRNLSSLSGTALVDVLKNMNVQDREAVFTEQFLQGNVPSRFRSMIPVRIKGQDAAGNMHVLTIWVTHDYLAVGSDANAFRIPLTPLTAQKIADATNCYLPTRKIVNEIYANANVRLTPSPMTPGPEMASMAYALAHNATVNKMIESENIPERALIAGHKKDVVLTARLRSFPDRVAIYGWHKSKNRPIQPLSLVHGIEYADYSHGIRLVHRVAKLDGAYVDLRSIMLDQNLTYLVNDEGAEQVTSYKEPPKVSRVPSATSSSILAAQSDLHR